MSVLLQSRRSALKKIFCAAACILSGKATNVFSGQAETLQTNLTADPLGRIQSWPSPRDNFNFLGKTSPEFHDMVLAGIKAVPSAQIDFLVDKEYVFNFSQTTDEFAHGQLCQPYDPTDFRTTNQYGGLSYSQKLDGKRMVALSEYRLDYDVKDPKTEIYPTTEKIKKGVWHRQLDIGNPVLWHETGHAVNYVIEEHTGAFISDCDEFHRRYEADLQALGGSEKAAEKDYDYFAAADKEIDARRDEVFAELSAYYYGEGMSGDMPSDWPRCNEFVVDLQKKMEKAYEFGGVKKIIEILPDLKKGPDHVLEGMDGPKNIRAASLDAGKPNKAAISRRDFLFRRPSMG